MSDETKTKTDEAVEKLKDKADDLFVDAVEAMSKDNKTLHKHVDDTKEALEKHVKRSNEDLEAKVEQSVGDIMGAIDKLDTRVNVFGKTAPLAQSIQRVEQTNVLRGVIPDEVKALANRFESQVLPAIPDEAKRLKDTEVAMAVHAWWIRATQSQHRKFNKDLPRIAEEMEKLERALEEYHFGSEEIAKAVQKAALAEDADATGGYLVPTIVASEVMRLVADAGKVTPLCRPWPMTKKVENVPNEATAVTINWIDEANTLTGGDPTFGQTALTAEKLAGRATMSIEVFEDSNVALLPYLLSVFSEKMAGELDYQMILGDGSGPQITGVMNGSGINAITSGTAAGRSLTWALLVSTFTGASEGSARDGGYWFCSPAGYTQLLSLVDSNGRPIVQMDVQGAPAGAILGKPIIESARLGGNLTLDDVTNTATKIVFGPPRTMLFGTRTGMRWDVTDQVNWATYQMDARLIGRYAGNVGVPAAWSYLGQISY